MIYQRYISNELTHFIGRSIKSNKDKYTLFKKILTLQYLSYPPDFKRNLIPKMTVTHGIGNTITSNTMINPDMVCFCDIPSDDLSIHIRKYSKFGLSFRKEFIEQAGGAPVFYIPINSKVISYDENDSRVYLNRGEHFNRWLPLYFKYYDLAKSSTNEEISINIEEVDRFIWFNILSYMKFFNSTLPENNKDNFYFEREWRVIGSVNFSLNDVISIYIPSSFINNFKKDFPDFKGQIIFTDKY